MTGRCDAVMVCVLAALPAVLVASPSPPPALASLVRSLDPPPLLPQEGPILLAAGDARVRALEAEASGRWSVEVDPGSGAVRRAFGAGIPLAAAGALARDARPPSPCLDDLEQRARSFIARHRDLLVVGAEDLRLDLDASQPIDGGRLQPLVFRRELGGVPVEHGQLLLLLDRGRLTYLNATGLGAIGTIPAPALDATASWQALVAQVGRSLALAGAVEIALPELVLVEVRSGWHRSHRLLRRHVLRLPGGVETWRAAIDAASGELLELVDLNRYACALDPARASARVLGGIRPESQADAEVVRGLSYPLVRIDGRREDGDGGGYFPYVGGNASAALDGTFFQVACNGCTNQPYVASSSDGILDFGTGGPGPVTNGTSTVADRTVFYQANVLRRLATGWSARPWLTSLVAIETNAPLCNAFWNGSGLVFGNDPVCGDAAQTRDIVAHEWGHGLDQNDGVLPVEGATGEAYGDHLALLLDHDACIGDGPGGIPGQNDYCLDLPGCPTTLSCAGRNLDEKRTPVGPVSTASVPTLCPPSSGCRGPLGRECHCEGQIWGQAGFHLAMNFLTGIDYDTGLALPAGNPGYPPVAAWFQMERLFFNGSAIFASYAPSRFQSLGASVYDAYMLVDDDDGDLLNGTPNAAYINQAFAHHGIAETVIIPDSSDCLAPAGPAFTVAAATDPVDGRAQVEVSWDDVTASSYVVYRTFALHDAWLQVRAQVPDTNAPTYSVIDREVAIGETLHYTVVAIASSGCPSSGEPPQSVVVALPDLTVAVGAIDDSPPNGDGDGLPDPGEVLAVRLDLSEVAGLAGANGVSVTLSTSDPDASVTGPGPVAYGDIAAGTTMTGPASFEVTVALSHPCNAPLPLVAAIAATNACELRSQSLQVAGGCLTRPGGIDGFVVARQGEDVSLAWAVEPLAEGGYRVYRGEDDKRLVPVLRDGASDPRVRRVAESAGSPGATGAIDPDAVPGRPDNANLFFYQVVGVAADGSEGAN